MRRKKNLVNIKHAIMETGEDSSNLCKTLQFQFLYFFDTLSLAGYLIPLKYFLL